MSTYTDEEVGNAMPVFITNPGDISSGGGGSGGATLAEQQAQTTFLDSIDATGAKEAKQDATIAELTTANSTLSDVLVDLQDIENLIGTSNTRLTAIDNSVDGVEALIGSTNTLLNTIDGRVDSLETLVGTTNTTLSTIDGHVDNLETQVGAVNETAAADSSTSSGLNGLLRLLANLVTTLTSKLPSSIGQKVKTNSLSVTLASDADGLPAGENVIGVVGGKTTIVVSTPTVSTSPAYSAGDSIGGKLTLVNALRVAANTAFLQSLMITDRSNQKPTGNVYIFKTDPTASTLTDNAAAVFSTNDFDVIAVIPVTSADYSTVNSKAYASLTPTKAVYAASGTSLYAAFVASSTPTFVSTSDLQLIFSFIQD